MKLTMPLCGRCQLRSNVRIRGLSTVGTKSRNSLLNWPGEGIEEAFLDTRKQQFSMKCRAQKVVFALFTSQVKENELQFLPSSYFWFLPCSNPRSAHRR